MTKDKRSNKWAFLLYQESAPENYLEVLKNFRRCLNRCFESVAR